MTAIRELQAGDWRVRLDIGGQVLTLETNEYRRQPSELPPTLPCSEEGPISAATLLLKAKQFDDGLYAAVELAAQRGTGNFPGIATLLHALATDPATASLVFAACGSGGLPVQTPPNLRTAVRAAIEDFLSDELRCKPLGFYTWTPELEAVFRQDRLLQGPLDGPTAAALIRALDRTPDGWRVYDKCLRLAARLTNPLATPSLRDEIANNRAFFPASRSHEVTLIEKLYGDQPIPEGFDLMGELIRRVRAGQVSLSPTEHSGWYDHQTWSLEPLIVPDAMPESPRVDLGKRYRGNLEDLFRGVLALTRETHAKQVAVGMGGGRGPSQQPIWVLPDLTVEPLPSLYSRRAACYRFVRSVLEEAFGADALRCLHRLTPEGPVGVDLATELTTMERLFDGAASVSLQEIGMGPITNSEEAVRCFTTWREGMEGDLDVSRDARMMVPVFFDVQRRKTKVWAFLGWRTVAVNVNYRVEPLVLRVEAVERPEPNDRLSVLRRKFRKPPEEPPAGPPPVVFSGDCYEFAVPVMAEVYVERLLDRDEFRTHCDRHRTREAILANLV